MNKVAIVEDTPDNRALIEIFLDGLYLLSEYEDGPSALEGIRKDRPDLVLLDISLPGMDGVEVLQHIRNDAALRDLPVIAFTAHAMSGDRERFLGAGFDDYVTSSR